jgi:hypothetical protein
MPHVLYAQNGKIANLKKHQKAPFKGTLFDVNASADLTVRLENHKRVCDLQTSKAVNLCDAKTKLIVNLKIAELESLQQRHRDILKIKNNQINFLQDHALKSVPWYESNKFWLATGLLVGFVASIGSAYAWGQVSR